jgi:ABC-type branched-subunit amino acid transport system ATPase component
MMRLCDRIMVMALGSEITTGTPAEVGADARVHELYFGSAGAPGSGSKR